MRKFCTLLVLLVSFCGMSQKIENGLVNLSLLEPEIVKQIKKHRKKLGLDTLHTSKAVYQDISIKNTATILKADSSFHPYVDLSNQLVNMKIYLEQCAIKKEKPISTKIEIMRYGEVLCTLGECKANTYQEYASYIIDVWLNSPPHKEIMEDDYELFEFSGFIACSAKKSRSKKYYVLVDFVNIVAF